MDLRSDVFLGLKRHDDELAVRCPVKYLAKILILNGDIFPNSDIFHKACIPIYLSCPNPGASYAMSVFIYKEYDCLRKQCHEVYSCVRSHRDLSMFAMGAMSSVSYSVSLQRAITGTSFASPSVPMLDVCFGNRAMYAHLRACAIVSPRIRAILMFRYAVSSFSRRSYGVRH